LQTLGELSSFVWSQSRGALYFRAYMKVARMSRDRSGDQRQAPESLERRYRAAYPERADERNEA